LWREKVLLFRHPYDDKKIEFGENWRKHCSANQQLIDTQITNCTQDLTPISRQTEMRLTGSQTLFGLEQQLQCLLSLRFWQELSFYF
jgi:hypothetical protein